MKKAIFLFVFLLTATTAKAATMKPAADIFVGQEAISRLNVDVCFSEELGYNDQVVIYNKDGQNDMFRLSGYGYGERGDNHCYQFNFVPTNEMTILNREGMNNILVTNIDRFTFYTTGEVVGTVKMKIITFEEWQKIQELSSQSVTLYQQIEDLKQAKQRYINYLSEIDAQIETLKQQSSYLSKEILEIYF